MMLMSASGMFGAFTGTHRITVTFLANKSGTRLREETLSLDELAQRIHDAHADTKDKLPWIKLARFGTQRSKGGSLRNNANVLGIHGIEGDYDGKLVSLADAKDKLVRSGLCALLYPSPSYTPEEPKWRVLCPTSEECLPARREALVARLNGLLGGILARESFTLSQGFFYGRVKNADHHCALFAGMPIDLADDLDVGAIGKGKERNVGERPHPLARPEDITDKRINALVGKLLDNVRRAGEGEKHEALRDNGLALSGYLYLTNWSKDEAVEQLLGALPSADDWDKARTTATWAVERGMERQIRLEERPNPKASRRPEPPPSPADDDTPAEPPPLWEASHPANDEELPPDETVTEQSVMRSFVAIYRDRLRFNHDSRSWFVWNGHYWQADRRQLAFGWALDLCRARSLSPTVQKVRFSSAVEQGARALPPLSTAQEDWDADLWLLGAPEGVVDLRTGILRPGRPEDMITHITAVTPADTPDCPRWFSFLDYAFDGNDQNVLFLQRYFGYCLTGLVSEETFMFLFGDAGTGKGTATETLRGILGSYADVVPIEVFISQTWRPAEYYRALLPGKRLILAAEPARDTVWNEAFVNEMTGGDRLSGRHPAGRPFDFSPTHKPLLHGNYMPKVHGQASGLKRRLAILPFNRPPATPDRGLKAALRAEWPGILRWGIEGCLAWQKRGLNPPEDVISANARYFRDQDTFGRWVEDRCVLDPSLHLGPAKLRTDFNAWAKGAGEETMTATQFNEAVERFKGAKLRRVTIHGTQLVQGIGLKPEPSWRDDNDR
jgi:putative DNA primase/helicase